MGIEQPPSWETDDDFKEVMTGVLGVTIVSIRKCYKIYQFCKSIQDIDGVVAEVGVYKGGSARLIAKMVEPKLVHLFDTFTGLPPPNLDKGDITKEGQFAVTIEEVKEYLADCKNVKIWKGLFPETACELGDAQFSFIHVDVDVYNSVKACCEFFYERMPAGAVMVFDDYGFPGGRLALDEFFLTKNESVEFQIDDQGAFTKQ